LKNKKTEKDDPIAGHLFFEISQACSLKMGHKQLFVTSK